MARLYDPDAFITKSGWPIRFVEALRLRRTQWALACEPSSHVLDLGCGPGNLLERLAGARRVGADFSETMLAQARRRLAGRGGFELVKADGAALPFDARSFDRVVCSEVLEHVPEPARVVAEIRRVCRPGARVVFTVPNEELINFTKRVILRLGLKRAISGDYAMSDDMLDAWHLNEISAERLIELCDGHFALAGRWSVPAPVLPYHRVLAFEAGAA
jgi:ubiquinone/menaquinone biosynthesis C-methylase UbiE